MKHFSPLEQRVEAAFTELCSAQERVLANPSASSTHGEREVCNRYLVLAKADDSFLKQRSRV